MWIREKKKGREKKKRTSERNKIEVCEEKRNPHKRFRNCIHTQKNSRKKRAGTECKRYVESLLY